MIESAEEFVRLRTSSRPYDYLRAAHEEAPTDVWFAVIENYPAMRSWVAHNKSVPIEILSMLSVDPDPGVRSVVADRRKLTGDLFRRLSRDPQESVRARIAYNKKVPRDVLEELSRDSAKLVRDAARNALVTRKHRPENID